jgi:indole-3-glycerol phosphate synthase
MTKTPDILKKIIRRKLEEIQADCEQISLQRISQMAANQAPPRGFVEAMKKNSPAIIAEIKKASPSKGILRANFDPVSIAKSYAEHGATCISVLTDKDFFQGSPEYLKQARVACDLPILCKDFIIDEYQIYQARVWGADCILLIVAALGDAQLNDLTNTANHLDLDVLIEVHNQAELERALQLPLKLIGINNRNLKTFATDLNTTLALKKLVPADKIIVTESGILNTQDVKTIRDANINTFLVGEAFMRAENPGKALNKLFN